MIKVKSNCADCGLPCIYAACPHYKIVIYECDDCGDEVNKLYHFDGEQLCISCIEKRLERVEYDG